MNPYLYIIVHHPQNPERTQWVNQWLDNNRLVSITTPTKVGEYCNEAKINGKRVFVHRCGWGDSNPVVCCSVRVLEVCEFDEKTSFVKFEDQHILNATPPQMAYPGRNFYWDKSIE